MYVAFDLRNNYHTQNPVLFVASCFASFFASFCGNLMLRIQKKSIISSNSISWTVEFWKIKHFTEIKFHKLHTYNTIFLHKLYFTKSSTWFHLSNRIWELLILKSFLLKTIILYYHRQGIIRFFFLDKPYKNKNEWNRMKLKTRLKRLFCRNVVLWMLKILIFCDDLILQIQLEFAKFTKFSFCENFISWGGIPWKHFLLCILKNTQSDKNLPSNIPCPCCWYPSLSL